MSTKKKRTNTNPTPKQLEWIRTWLLGYLADSDVEMNYPLSKLIFQLATTVYADNARAKAKATKLILSLEEDYQILDAACFDYKRFGRFQKVPAPLAAVDMSKMN